MILFAFVEVVTDGPCLCEKIKIEERGAMSLLIV